MMPDLVIEIGGAPLRVSMHDEALREAVCGHYAKFITASPTAPPFDLTVEVDAARFPDRATLSRDAHLSVRATFADGLWRLERHDFRVALRPQTRKARLEQVESELASTDAAMRMIHSILSVGSGGFLLHAASAVLGGGAYVFTGVSGAGKTTISGLLPPSATLLTDEISYILPDGGGFRAYGTPFAGNLGIPGENVAAPLKAVYLLAKGPQNSVEPINQRRAAAALLRNVLFFARDDQDLTTRVFEAICRLVQCVPVYRLTFAPTPAVWDVIQ
jgi:hypothetical protein